jgi:hypothetical protein
VFAASSPLPTVNAQMPIVSAAIAGRYHPRICRNTISPVSTTMARNGVIWWLEEMTRRSSDTTASAAFGSIGRASAGIAWSSRRKPRNATAIITR